MNAQKMRQIGKDILAEPRRFNIDTWGLPIDTKADAEEFGHAKTAVPPCGTICCFAGEWALRYLKVSPEEIAYSPWDLKDLGHVSSLCLEDLALPNDELFYADSWPDEVKMPERAKPGTKRYAEHFVNVVLESYIRTNGWENETA